MRCHPRRCRLPWLVPTSSTTMRRPTLPLRAKAWPTKSTTLLSSVAGGVKTWEADDPQHSLRHPYGRAWSLSSTPGPQGTATAYSPATGAPITSFAVTGPMGAGGATTTVVEPGHGTHQIREPTSTTRSPRPPTTRWAGSPRCGSTTDRPPATPNRQHTYRLANPSLGFTRRRWAPTETRFRPTPCSTAGSARAKPSPPQRPTGSAPSPTTRYDARGLTVKQTVLNLQRGVRPGCADSCHFCGRRRATAAALRLTTSLGRKTKRTSLWQQHVFKFQSPTVYSGDRAA